jgi:hypothetical protein
MDCRDGLKGLIFVILLGMDGEMDGGVVDS